MQEIVVQQNQVEYVGAFTAPAFELWGDEKSLLAGLYRALSGSGASLSDFHIERGSDDPGTQSIEISLSAVSFYRFRFDRVEATLSNFDDDALDAFVGALTEGARWLREVVRGFRFQSHLVGYAAHCSVPGSSSAEVLRQLNGPELKCLGESQGSGIIFHGLTPESNRRSQFTIDHSLAVEDGLFVNLVSAVTVDTFDYDAEERWFRNTLDQALGEVRLSRSGAGS